MHRVTTALLLPQLLRLLLLMRLPSPLRCSPLEVSQGAATLGWSLQRYLSALRDAGVRWVRWVRWVCWVRWVRGQDAMGRHYDSSLHQPTCWHCVCGGVECVHSAWAAT